MLDDDRICNCDESELCDCAIWPTRPFDDEWLADVYDNIMGKA